MSKVLALLAAALLFSPVVGAQSQNQKKPSRAKPLQVEKPAVATPLYASSPVDQATDVLGPNYAGHSCRALAKALLAAKPIKDEYETTAAFNERVAGLMRQPLLSNLTLNDYIGFIPMGSLVIANYNADAGLLEISGRDRSVNVMAGKSLQQTLVIDSEIKSQTKYPGSNAYGKQVEVSKTEHTVCAIAATNIPSFEDPIKFRGSVAMSPEEAQAAKGKIETLYVGKLVAPYWGKYSKVTMPTVAVPFDDFSTGDALFMNVNEIWLFNKVTGKVYQKVKI